ncbi:hypothetical protein TNCV_4545241, partial [Trichonephila clavipes]
MLILAYEDQARFLNRIVAEDVPWCL